MERRCVALSLLQNSVTDRINRFLANPGYIIAVMLLSIAAHLLSLELVAYTVFALIALYVGIVGNDFLPISPLLLFAYILPSSGNNPGKNDASVFSSPWFYGLVMVVVISLLIFLLRNIKQLFHTKRMLFWGMALLCASYLLSGLGSDAYASVASNNLVFATLQCVCLILPYLLLSGGVKWHNVRKDYLAWTGTCAGVLLVCEILGSYINGGVVVNGIIDRQKIFTGWGMYNNMGAMLAMMIPFAFSLSTHMKKVLPGILVGFVFLLATIMTCSRTSLVAAAGIFCLCTIISIFYGQHRKRIIFSLGTVVLILVLLIVLFHEQLLQLFSGFLSKITDPSSRHILFSEGWKVFLESPVFGSSFYSPGYQPWDFSTVASFSSFFPPRWHNTIVQLLASCGIVGLIAYGFHRYQTIRLIFRRKGISPTYIVCSIAVLLACCLLDCHFFNMGPVLFYSTQLAFLEFAPSDTE